MRNTGKKSIAGHCWPFAVIILAFAVGCTDRQGSAWEAGNPVTKNDGQLFAGELPPTSIYQLNSEWHTPDNDTIPLASLRGRIPVMAMIFTHCEFACPRIIDDMKNIEKQLSPEKAGEVVFVLVSFDTERDQPARLKEFAEHLSLGKNWLLLHGSEEDVRMLSMLLEVSYRKQAGNTFAHSNQITLLNRQGVIVSQIEGLGTSASPLISRIEAF